GDLLCRTGGLGALGAGRGDGGAATPVEGERYAVHLWGYRPLHGAGTGCIRVRPEGAKMAQKLTSTWNSREKGQAAARCFGRRGWNVALGCRENPDRAEETARTLREQGRRALVLQGDVSCPEQAAALVRRAEEELGPLEALVCCAGVALPQ